MKQGSLSVLLVGGSLLAAGCQPRYVEAPARPAPRSPAPVQPKALASASAKPDRDAKPPAEAPLGDASLPAVSSRTLPGGLGLRVIARRELPLVSVRLVVRAGIASDADKPGVAELTARLLASSGAGRWTRPKLAARIESLGNRLQVHVDRDATWLGLDVTRDHLDSALDLMAAIATQPRWQPTAFLHIRQRTADAAAARVAADPRGAMRKLLQRRLFELPVGVDPYAHGYASADEIAARSLADCRSWRHDNFAPDRAVLVVAGDVHADDVARSAQAAFARWKGHAAARTEPNAALAPDRVEVDVIDRPKSHDSRIAVATLGPGRDSPRWAGLLAAVELVGGASGRLARDLRDRRHLVQQVDARVQPMAHGPALIVVSANSRTPHTAQAVQGILEAFGKFAGGLPDDAEVDTAMRALVERSLRQTQTVQGLARMGRQLAKLGLPDESYQDLDRSLRDLDPAAVNAAAQLFLRARHVRIVVSGDASRVAHALARFGPVHIVDPARGFTVTRSLPADPSAPLAIPPRKTR